MQLHPKRISENEIKRKNIFMEKSINCTQKKISENEIKRKKYIYGKIYRKI